MDFPTKSDFRDVLLSINWALISFFLVKLTPFEVASADFLKNVGGIGLFAFFVILFELVGKEIIWEIAGKHHRVGKQIMALVIILIILAAAFAVIA